MPFEVKIVNFNIFLIQLLTLKKKLVRVNENDNDNWM